MHLQQITVIVVKMVPSRINTEHLILVIVVVVYTEMGVPFIWTHNILC